MTMTRWSSTGWLAIALVIGCKGEETAPKDPIKIGLIAPKSGALEGVGQSFERIAGVAVAEINAKGGVNGHPLELIVKDDMTDPATADMMLQQLIDEGAVAAVGPATSGAVTMAMPRAKASKFPIISPSSTAPSLVPRDDDGYVFRDVPNDNVQGIAMAYYLTQEAMPAVTSVIVVHEDTTYGEGLAGSFTTSFQGQGGTVDATLTFAQNLPDYATDPAPTDAIVSDIVAEDPTMVILVALEGDALKILNAWDASGMATTTQWFFADGARSAGFLTGIPASIVGARGTAPTNPITGDAYAELQQAYEDAHPDNLSDQVYGPNVWDAVYLIAAALAKQDADFPGEPFGREHLRDAIHAVSKPPGQILHAGLWVDLANQIESGSEVDYDGASGPVDFDDEGESIGPYEVWEVVNEGGQNTFEQVLFLDARDLQSL